MPYTPEPMTAFETAMLAALKIGIPPAIFQGEKKWPAYNNMRAYRFTTGKAAVLDCDVLGNKYGVSIAGTAGVLVKNFRFRDRRSSDRFGAAIILDMNNPSTAPSYVSNAWLDLNHPEPIADYTIANNECICIEPGHPALNVRKTVMIRAEDAAIDSKGPYNLDYCFVAAGHRCLRMWGIDVTAANTIFLMNPGTTLISAHGTTPTNFKYYNCKFGIIGQTPDQWVDTLPIAWTTEETAGTFKPTKLTADPYARDVNSFWQPTTVPIPEVLMPVDPMAVRLADIGRKITDIVASIMKP